jgi:hypothetical protein
MEYPAGIVIGDILTIKKCVESYHRFYGKYPFAYTNSGDAHFLSDRFMPFVSGKRSEINPSNIVILTTDGNSTIPSLDPWQKPYHIVVDSDGDGNCDTKEFGRIVGQKIVVWSEGGGPITSWQPAVLKVLNGN